MNKNKIGRRKMRRNIFVLIFVILLFLGCAKDGPEHPSPEPGNFILLVDNDTWFYCDIYVEGQYVGNVDAYTGGTMGSFEQSESTYIKAMFGDSIIDSIMVNTMDTDTFGFNLLSPTFQLTVNNQQISYGSYKWYIDYDILVNGDAIGKWNDYLGEFKQSENIGLWAKLERFPDIQTVVDTRGSSNYTWNIQVPMFTLYINCDFAGAGSLLIDNKWNIGDYQSFKTTNMGELPQSDSTHLVAYPFDSLYSPMEVIVNTDGLTTYTWQLVQ